MNKTQKEAWFNLASSLFVIGVASWTGFTIFGLKKFPDKVFMFTTLAFFFLFTVIFLFCVSKKQSPKEPEADERDNLIQRNAAIAAFASMWVLLFIANLSVQLAFGAGGSIPVWSFAIMNVTILFLVLIVYSAAVLVQYGRGGDNGGK